MPCFLARRPAFCDRRLGRDPRSGIPTRAGNRGHRQRPICVCRGLLPRWPHVAAGTNRRPDYVESWMPRRATRWRTEGHGDAVVSVAYSRDGKRLLTGSYENTARLWDLATGDSRVFAGHDWWVWSVSFSPDERRILHDQPRTGRPSSGPWRPANRNRRSWGTPGPVYGGRLRGTASRWPRPGTTAGSCCGNPDQLRPFDFDVLTSGRTNPPPPCEYAAGAHRGGACRPLFPGRPAAGQQRQRPHGPRLGCGRPIAAQDAARPRRTRAGLRFAPAAT